MNPIYSYRNMSSPITVQPFAPVEGSQVDFGAFVSNADVEKLTGKISS